MLQHLNEGLDQLKLNLSETAKKDLLTYVELLVKWNRTYNLTAVNTQEEIVSKHILDSLAVAPYLQGEQIVDVGTGAGMPGLPLAMLYPERHFVLLDSNGKKIRFLNHLLQKISVQNVTIVQARAETFAHQRCFDTVLTRAFSSLKEMLRVTQHLCCKTGYFLAMKGKYPELEIAAVPADFKIIAIHPLKIPFVKAERHLVCIQIKKEE